MARRRSRKTDSQEPLRPEIEAAMRYRREERLGMASAPARKQTRGGVFASNRSLLILLVDVVVIVLIVTVLRALGMLDPASGRVEGYGCTLEAARLGGEIHATVTLRPRGERPEGEGAERVFCRFYPTSDSQAFVSTSAVLDGGGATVRGVVPDLGAPTHLSADVTVGTESIRLRVRIR